MKWSDRIELHYKMTNNTVFVFNGDLRVVVWPMNAENLFMLLDPNKSTYGGKQLRSKDNLDETLLKYEPLTLLSTHP